MSNKDITKYSQSFEDLDFNETPTIKSSSPIILSKISHVTSNERKLPDLGGVLNRIHPNDFELNSENNEEDRNNGSLNILPEAPNYQSNLSHHTYAYPTETFENPIFERKSVQRVPRVSFIKSARFTTVVTGTEHVEPYSSPVHSGLRKCTNNIEDTALTPATPEDARDSNNENTYNNNESNKDINGPLNANIRNNNTNNNNNNNNINDNINNTQSNNNYINSNSHFNVIGTPCNVNPVNKVSGLKPTYGSIQKPPISRLLINKLQKGMKFDSGDYFQHMENSQKKKSDEKRSKLQQFGIKNDDTTDDEIDSSHHSSVNENDISDDKINSDINNQQEIDNITDDNEY